MTTAEQVKLPPQDLEAEQACIGAALVEPGATAYALAYVSSGDFYREAHQAIFAAIESIHAARHPVDLITVCAELRKRGLLDSVGGAEYLDSLIDVLPTAAHVARYATIIAEKARMRRLARVAAEVQEAAYEETISVEEAVGKLLAVGVDKSRPQSATGAEIANEIWGWLEGHVTAKPQAIPPFLGIPTADEAMGGLAGEELVVLKAREKYGKTAVLRQGALETTKWLKRHGRPETVLVYLCEGSRMGWLLKALVYLGDFDTAAVKRGSCYVPEEAKGTTVGDRMEEKRTRLFAALGRFACLPIIVNAELNSLEQIEADCMWLVAKGVKPIGVWVDYLQKLQAPGRSTTEQVRAAAQGLVNLHRRLKVPVITASQVTRDPGGETKAYFGHSVQQEGSCVLELERGGPEDKTMAQQLKSKEARLVCQYVRYGEPFKTVRLQADLDHARFLDLDAHRTGIEQEGPPQDY